MTSKSNGLLLCLFVYNKLLIDIRIFKCFFSPKLVQYHGSLSVVFVHTSLNVAFFSKPRPMLVVQKWRIVIIHRVRKKVALLNMYKLFKWPFFRTRCVLFCIMLIFSLSFLVGLLHDFQILHTDVQIFQLGSHDFLKIQVYWEPWEGVNVDRSYRYLHRFLAHEKLISEMGVR